MKVLALDIGGANIKAAHGEVAGDGSVTEARAVSFPFALWKRPDDLCEKLRTVAELLPSFDAVAVTMTGELCDCFESRREGVLHILKHVEQFTNGRAVRVWLTEGRLVSPQVAADRWLACASANWHAQATWVASLYPRQHSLLIDTGSTTTDSTLLVNGMPHVQGLTDTVRMNLGELVYTGVRRTPVMSLSPLTMESPKIDDAPMHLMAEHFATTADVYVLLGDLPEEAWNRDTADARPLTRDAAQTRLLRMLGADRESVLAISRSRDDAPAIMARHLAEDCARKQQRMIGEAIERFLHSAAQASKLAVPVRVEQVIVTGSGWFLAARAARDVLPAVDVIAMQDRIGAEASAAACAWALLHLWSHPGTGVPGL